MAGSSHDAEDDPEAGDGPAATAPVPAIAAAPVAAPAPSAVLPRRPPAPSPADRFLVAGHAPRTADLDATRDLLAAWHAGYPGRRPSWTVEAGLDPSRKAGAALYEASFAALLAARGLDGAAIAATLLTLRDTGVLLAAGKGKLPVDAVGAALARSPTPALAAGCESVVHLPRLLAGTGDPDLLRAETPRDLLAGLWRRLYEPLFPLAPFLLARFLGEAGSIPEALRPAGLVPTFAVREAAFRIGFLDRLYAGSFEDLVDASQGLADRFGPPDFEGPLARAAEGFGCAFRCPRAPACPLACREKGEIAH